MDDVAIARAIHVLSVVVWIGGVTMVTTVLLPMAQRSADGIAIFEMAERRFAWQARIAILLAGASGFYMVDRLGLWERFGMIAYWWMGAMLGLWLLFALLLFVFEPLFGERWFRRRAVVDAAGALRLMQRFHWIMLVLSAITIFAAVAGSHGLMLFD